MEVEEIGGSVGRGEEGVLRFLVGEVVVGLGSCSTLTVGSGMMTSVTFKV